MKTLIKNVVIEFELKSDKDSEIILSLADNSVRKSNTVRIKCNGFLLGLYKKVLTTHIIYFN